MSDAYHLIKFPSVPCCYGTEDYESGKSKSIKILTHVKWYAIPSFSIILTCFFFRYVCGLDGMYIMGFLSNKNNHVLGC